MPKGISLCFPIALAVGICCLVVVAIRLFLLENNQVAPILELVAITFIGIYTIFVSSRIRRSDVEAVVPSRVLAALDSLTEGLLILDERQQILLANQAFSVAVGKTADQLVGMPVGDLAWELESADNAAVDEYPWTRAIQSGERQTEQLLTFRHADGALRVFSINCSPIGGAGSAQAGSKINTRGALATFRDVTQIEAHRAEMHSRIRHLEILAAHDPLTECLNRRALVPKMQAVWDLAVKESQPIACLMIDNDHFKQVNDTYGHEVGDAVLREVAGVIRRSVPYDALVCRYGGEEFCVVLPHTWIETAAEIAEKLRQHVAAIRFSQPTALQTTISIGVSETRFGATNPQELITEADQCLYLAKQQGRNRVVIMSASVVQLLQPEQSSQVRD